MFQAWLEHSIYPLYPDMSPNWEYDENGNFLRGPVILKLDSGPGRIGNSAENVQMRQEAAARGLILYPGPQNTTSCTQEMDDRYTEFQ